MIGSRVAVATVLLASVIARGDDGTLPKLDYPAVATTAKAGEWVLALDKQIFHNRELVAPGATTSQVKDHGAVPNALIIPIPKGGKARLGDVVLTWWQSGSGMQRAIVVGAQDPAKPVVRYLDISYDNPAKGGPKHDTPIGQLEEQLAPDTFAIISKPFDAGTTVACKDGAGHKLAHVVSAAGDRLLLQASGGAIVARAKADCPALPVRPTTLQVKDKAMAELAGTMRPATVVKLDPKIGRVWVTFDGLGKAEHALPYGNVIAKL